MISFVRMRLLWYGNYYYKNHIGFDDYPILKALTPPIPTCKEQ